MNNTTRQPAVKPATIMTKRDAIWAAVHRQDVITSHGIKLMIAAAGTPAWEHIVHDVQVEQRNWRRIFGRLDSCGF